MVKRKKRGPLPDLPDPESATGTPGKGGTGDHGSAQNAIQPYAPQKNNTVKPPRGKTDQGASPSLPPLSKAPRMDSPEIALLRQIHSLPSNHDGDGYDLFGDEDYDEDSDDEDYIGRELEFSDKLTEAIETILDQDQTIKELERKLTESEKRASVASEALKASQDAQKTMEANFAKDKQNTQKQLTELQKRLEQLEKKEKKGNAPPSQPTTLKASPKVSLMETDQVKLPGPPPLPPPPVAGSPVPQSIVQNSSEACTSHPQQPNAEAPWAKDLQKVFKTIEKKIDQLQAAVIKGSPGSSSSYAAVLRQGKGRKGKGAAPCPPPTQQKPPSPDLVSSPYAQQTFVLAGVESLRGHDQSNEALRQGAETWLADIVGEPIHVRSARFLGLQGPRTAPRKVLVIVDTPEQAQLIRRRRCKLQGKSECILDGLTSSELAYQRRLRGAFKDAQKKGLSPQFQRARLFIKCVMEDGTVQKKEITEP